jgi:hypothetical protein
MINKTCLFLHGLESGPNGRKAIYLKKKFYNVSAPDLQTGMLGFRSNSFMMSAIRNAPSIFYGSYFADVTQDVLRGGTDIVMSSVAHTPPDLVVASSMGGAIALEALRKGTISSPVILLAPALGRLLGKNNMDQWCDEFIARDNHGKHPIIVVHAVMDDVIDIEHSRQLCHRIGAELLEVAEGDHSLNDFLLDGFSREDGSPQGDQLSRIIDRILDIN